MSSQTARELGSRIYQGPSAVNKSFSLHMLIAVPKEIRIDECLFPDGWRRYLWPHPGKLCELMSDRYFMFKLVQMVGESVFACTLWLLLTRSPRSPGSLALVNAKNRPFLYPSFTHKLSFPELFAPPLRAQYRHLLSRLSAFPISWPDPSTRWMNFSCP